MRAAILLLLFMASRLLSAQEYHYSVRNYKAIDGLPQSQVKMLLEDKNGYLWIGTEGGGLARFDGHNFKVYTTLDGLQSNIINDLLLDEKQNIWVTHPRGISKFDGTSFRKFEQPGGRVNATRLRRIYEFQDTLFFISSPGYIGKIHNDSVHYWSRPVFPRKEGQHEQLISFARQAPDGTLCFCINQKAFYCRNGSESFWIRFSDSFSHITNVFTYRGRIWLNTDTGFWSANLQEKTMTKENFPIQNPIIGYDSTNNVFWTVKGNMLMKESVSGMEVKSVKVMEDIDFFGVLVDSEGNTWLGSNGSGLYKYFVQDFDRCGSQNLTNVMAVHQDRYGATWIGSATKGLFKIQRGKVTSYDIPGSGKRRSVNAIAESPEGVLYIGGIEGLGKYNRQTDAFEWQAFPYGTRRTGVLNIQFDDKGGIWLGMAGGGVNYIRDNKVKNYSVENGLNTNVVMSQHYSQFYDRLFLGDEFGISEIAGEEVSSITIGGLDNTTVLAIQPLHDSLLMLSTGGSGLVIYNPQTKFKRFITTRDGLASDFIYFTASDEKGRLWVGSEKGITRISLDAHFNVNEHFHFDYDNGLTGVETNQNAFFFSGKEKYFGLVDGLYSYNEYERDKKNSFRLHLTSVELFYGEFSTSDYAEGKTGFFNIPVNLSLPPDKNHITFRFNKVDKRNPKSVKFKYFLQGFDKTWSLPSSANEVTYSNLPPGEFTLLVMSTDIGGTWGDNILSYKFRVKTPFYARTPFMIGMMIFLAVLIVSILYLRVRQRVRHMVMVERVRLKEQEKVRRDIARDFHDEMGNQLTRIINYISLLKMNGENGTARNGQRELYTKVEQSAKYLYTGTRDFIWSIDPSNDELSKLFIHIRDFGEKLFEEKNISFRAVNKIRDTIRLPYGFSREANLIFKEAMTNAFKYSCAANITLAMHQEEEEIILCLEDDGIGCNLALLDRPEGGLKNMRERAERISVDLSIQSEPTRGTIISIRFKNTKKLKYGIAI